MQQNFLTADGEVVEYTLTCETIRTKVIPAIWLQLILVKVQVDDSLIAPFLNVNTLQVKPVKHVGWEKAFCKCSVLLHCYLFFYLYRRTITVNIVLCYPHDFTGEPILPM